MGAFREGGIPLFSKSSRGSRIAQRPREFRQDFRAPVPNQTSRVLYWTHTRNFLTGFSRGDTDSALRPAFGKTGIPLGGPAGLPRLEADIGKISVQRLNLCFRQQGYGSPIADFFQLFVGDLEVFHDRKQPVLVHDVETTDHLSEIVHLPVAHIKKHEHRKKDGPRQAVVKQDGKRYQFWQQPYHCPKSVSMHR